MNDMLKNLDLKKIIIAILVFIGLYFGYDLTITPKVVTPVETEHTVDTLVIDSTVVDTMK